MAATSKKLLSSLVARVQDDAVTKELGGLRERVALIEVRPVVPGPSGDPGPPGRDGVDGKAGLTYHGVFQDGKRGRDGRDGGPK